MANEIQVDYAQTGKTLYALIINSSGQIWNGSAFETIASANWTTYAVTMTEKSTTGIYTGTFPVVASGLYSVSLRERVGGSPATTDPLVGASEMNWSGTAEVVPIDVSLTNSTTVVSAVSGGVINAYRGSTWSFNLVIGNISGFSKLWFTVKNGINDSDAQSVVQIEQSAGLLVLNGSSTVTTGDGSITVNNATTGSITITLKPSSSSHIAIATGINYDVKVLVGAVVSIMADGRGKMNVLGDVTRKTS